MCAPGAGITGEGPDAPHPQGMPILTGLKVAATSHTRHCPVFFLFFFFLRRLKELALAPPPGDA